MRSLIAGISTLSATGALCVVPVLLPTVASAGDAACSPYTRGQLASASIRRADIPPAFSSDPQRAASFRSCGQTGLYEVCVDKNGNKIFGDRPGKHMNVSYTLMSAGTPGNVTETVAASSDIYSYRGVRAAQTAWQRLLNRTTRCAPTVKAERVFDGIPVDVNVTQRTKRLSAVGGFPGLRNAQTVAVDLGAGPQALHVFVDGFTSYRLSGSTILRTQFAHYDQTSLASVRLSPRQKRWTTNEAVTIAKRVAALG